jgi:hypothetical protein
LREAVKRAAIELWKATVPLKNIRDKLQMIERDVDQDLGQLKWEIMTFRVMWVEDSP